VKVIDLDVVFWYVTVPILVVLFVVLFMMVSDLQRKLRDKPHSLVPLYQLNDDPRLYSLQGICRQDFYTPELLEQLRDLEPGQFTNSPVGVFKRMS
jgi:hypothetical protein